MLPWQTELQFNQTKPLMQPFLLFDTALHDFFIFGQLTLEIYFDDGDNLRTMGHCHTNTSLEPSDHVS